ncbi:hypothetical protein [Flavobacterium sp. H122]|uniref:hypothetical protein n=1 Tax=Flavobacterium sp. H122 TaxID=2529860 RepID=UPI00145B60AE|nr:hypothetical protein [Flavobacterium sp. H122]
MTKREDATNPFKAIKVLKNAIFLNPNLILQNIQNTVNEDIPSICRLIFRWAKANASAIALLKILARKKKNNSGRFVIVKLFVINETHKRICTNNGIFRWETLVTIIESIFFNVTNK